jgi:hypothetical protein
VIVKGNSRSAGKWWAGHLMRADTNERVEVVEISGLGAENIRDGFSEMQAIASGTHCTNYAYIVSLNPRENEHLTREQWLWAVDRTADELGLAGQPRMIVQHDKEGRQHWHVVWSRIDADSMTAISDGLTYPKHERAARAIEQELELEPVPSVLVKDRDTPRPERRPRDYEGFRAQQSAIDPQDVAAELKTLWQEADSGQAFKAAIEDAGYILAKGERRDFVIIDRAGDDHSLGKRLTGTKAADVRARMTDIDRDSLPSVDEARTLATANAEGGEATGDAPLQPEEKQAAPGPGRSPLDAQQAANFLMEPDTRLEGTELAARFGEGVRLLPPGIIEDTSDPLAGHRDAATHAIPSGHAEAAPDVLDGLIEDDGEPLEGAAADDAPTIAPQWSEARAGQFSDERERFTGWERFAATVRGYWERLVDFVQDEQSGTPAPHPEQPEAKAPDADSRVKQSWLERVMESKAMHAATRLLHGWSHRDGVEVIDGLKDTAAIVEDILAKGPRQPGAGEPAEQAQAQAFPPDAAEPAEPTQPAPGVPLEGWERFRQSARAEPEADAPQGWERFNQLAHAKPKADAPKPTPSAPEPEPPGQGPELD